MPGFSWDGTDAQFLADLDRWVDAAMDAVKAVADYFAPILEAYAKQNRPWADRTSIARQSLHAFTEELSQDIVALYLSHGVDYGLWLELKNNGRYAIIMPTIEAHIPQIEQMLKDIFR